MAEQQKAESDKHQIITVITGMKGSGKTALIKMVLLQKYKRVVIFDYMAAFGDSNCFYFKNISELAEYIKNKKIYRCRFSDINLFDQVAEFIYKIENLTFIIDEVAAILPNSTEKINGYLEDIIFRGRHSCIDIIACGQRATQININLRSQTDIYISFKQREKQDVMRVVDMMDLDDKKIVKSLKVGEYLEMDFNGVQKKSVEKLIKLLNK